MGVQFKNLFRSIRKDRVTSRGAMVAPNNDAVGAVKRENGRGFQSEWIALALARNNWERDLGKQRQEISGHWPVR